MAPQAHQEFQVQKVISELQVHKDRPVILDQQGQPVRPEHRDRKEQQALKVLTQRCLGQLVHKGRKVTQEPPEHLEL